MNSLFGENSFDSNKFKDSNKFAEYLMNQIKREHYNIPKI